MRSRRPRHLQIDGDRVARDAGLRPGQKPILAEQVIDQRRLAGIGPADNGDADRLSFRIGIGRHGFLALRRRLRQRRPQRVVKIGQAFAMFGADRDRLAEPERKGFENPRRAGAAFALIRHQDGGLARAAHQLGEGAIGTDRAGAGIDDKEHGIGLRNRRRRLRLHPARQAVAFGVFEAGGVDDRERQIAERAFTLAAVPRHARLIVDQRQTTADQPIEQRRFADIGPADNRDGEGHGQDFAKNGSISPIRDARRLAGVALPAAA